MHKDFYRIGPQTMAIMPDFDKYGHPESIILEQGKEAFSIKLKPRHLIDRTLRSYASSYMGAVQGAAYILKKNHTLPVLIKAEKPIILLPTESSTREGCMWLSLDHIIDFNEEEKGSTRISLTGGASIVAGISLHSFYHQFQKALFFRHHLERPDDRMTQAFEPGVTYHFIKGEGIRKTGKKE
ncbi:competence protein ComK [Bhargavaea ullalensis]|uniref:Competence protein ComK n=1 Tax=Bhargavaea ullalensis TaxID=1265685 RepID=A0ABV2GEB4_9BACL